MPTTTDSGGNISEDPLFCDAESGDYRVRSDSPCAPGGHPDGDTCAFIGALPVGCSAPAHE